VSDVEHALVVADEEGEPVADGLGAGDVDGVERPDHAGQVCCSVPDLVGDQDLGEGGQQVRRVEAKGGVFVTQKDQTATGESGVFDMQANTVTLLGNVVISQGQNVVKGDRLTVDLTSGTSRVECGKSQGQCRVQALIQPGSMRDKPAADAAAAAPAPVREAPRKRPSPAAGLY